MKYAFMAQKKTINEEVLWVAKSLHFQRCVGTGESLQEAVRRLEEEEIRFDSDNN